MEISRWKNEKTVAETEKKKKTLVLACQLTSQCLAAKEDVRV